MLINYSTLFKKSYFFGNVNILTTMLRLKKNKSALDRKEEEKKIIKKIIFISN